METVVTLWGKLPVKRRRVKGGGGGSGSAEVRAEEPEVCARVCAETEKVMTASPHLDLGLLLLLLACWQTPGMVGASESPLYTASACLCFSLSIINQSISVASK